MAQYICPYSVAAQKQTIMDLHLQMFQKKMPEAFEIQSRVKKKGKEEERRLKEKG